MNSGDFVENCTALVELENGEWNVLNCISNTYLYENKKE